MNTHIQTYTDLHIYAYTRNLGRPKLRFKDQCKTSMTEFSINVANWDMVAQDEVGWRAAVFIGAKRYEENRVQCAVENRQRRKCPTVDDSTVFYYCRHCQKPCRSRIGCLSHERRCSKIIHFPLPIVFIDEKYHRYKYTYVQTYKQACPYSCLHTYTYVYE